MSGWLGSEWLSSADVAHHCRASAVWRRGCVGGGSRRSDRTQRILQRTAAETWSTQESTYHPRFYILDFLFSAFNSISTFTAFTRNHHHPSKLYRIGPASPMTTRSSPGRTTSKQGSRHPPPSLISVLLIRGSPPTATSPHPPDAYDHNRHN